MLLRTDPLLQDRYPSGCVAAFELGYHEQWLAQCIAAAVAYPGKPEHRKEVEPTPVPNAPDPPTTADEGVAMIVECLSPAARRELAGLLANTLNIIDNVPQMRHLRTADFQRIVRFGRLRGLPDKLRGAPSDQPRDHSIGSYAQDNALKGHVRQPRRPEPLPGRVGDERRRHAHPRRDAQAGRQGVRG